MDILLDDIRDCDWEAETGMTHAEYVKPVRDIIREHGYKWGDRPELFRETFIKLVESEDNADALFEFYASDWYSRIWAAELPEKRIFEYLIRRGATATPSPAYLISIAETKTSNEFSILDHGAGLCMFGFAALASCYLPEIQRLDQLRRGVPNVFLYDVTSPVRRVMQRASVRCFKQGLYWRLIDRGGWNTRFWEKEKKRFDVISSIDVMEHLSNPIEELQSLANALKPGGVFQLMVFFNSDNGRDPTHLKKNEIYSQRRELWDAAIQACGLTPIMETQPGRAVFRKEG